MTELHDVFELVDVQSLRGQEVFNVYFYEYNELFVTTTPTFSQVLAENWVDQILPSVLACQSQNISHVGVRVRNLYDPADAFEVTLSEPGAVAEDGEGNFDAIAFQLGGETSAVKKGAKRIAGVPDIWEVEGVIVHGDGVAAGAALATAMEDSVDVGLIIPDPCFIPVIVKRVRSGVSGDYTYELPTSQVDGIKTRIVNALFEVLLTSQVSRKIGLGA